MYTLRQRYDISRASLPSISAPGWYASESGSHSCVPADAGYAANDSSAIPRPCEPGTVSVGGQSVCTPCRVGEFANRPALSACSKCPFPLTTNKPGRVSCNSAYKSRPSASKGSSQAAFEVSTGIGTMPSIATYSVCAKDARSAPTACAATRATFSLKEYNSRKASGEPRRAQPTFMNATSTPAREASAQGISCAKAGTTAPCAGECMDAAQRRREIASQGVRSLVLLRPNAKSVHTLLDKALPGESSRPSCDPGRDCARRGVPCHPALWPRFALHFHLRDLPVAVEANRGRQGRLRDCDRVCPPRKKRPKCGRGHQG